MPLYKTLLFDLFNTLISVGEVPEDIGQFTADILKLDHDVWNAACFGPLHDITQTTQHFEIIQKLAHHIDASISEEQIQRATEHRQRRFDYALIHVRSSVLDALSRLKQSGYRLALVSNASTAEVAAWPQSPLAKLIDFPVFSCECGFKKPDSSIFEFVLQNMGVNKQECLFIGDGGSDELKGAAQFGMTTVLTKQFSKPHRIAQVKLRQGAFLHHEIDHIVELIDLVAAQV